MSARVIQWDHIILLAIGLPSNQALIHATTNPLSIRHVFECTIVQAIDKLEAWPHFLSRDQRCKQAFYSHRRVLFQYFTAPVISYGYNFPIVYRRPIISRTAMADRLCNVISAQAI